MKPVSITLIAVTANLLLVSGLLILTDVKIIEHPADTNWLSLAAMGLVYAVIVGAFGWLMGSTVNGLLVYPKKRTRNLAISQVNIGLICLASLVAFWWVFLEQKALYVYLLREVSQYIHA